MDIDLFVSHGGTIKVANDGSVAGLLVRFGSPDTCDSDREFFTAKTDYGFDGRATIETPIYYHHGLDPAVGRTRLGYGTLKMVDDGVWFEGQLDKRKKYVKRIIQLAAMKDEGDRPVLGMSSGSLPHLVETRAAAKNTREITSWPLGGDASLTPTPADHRTYCTAIKSSEPAPTLEELCTRHAIKSAKADDAADAPVPHEGLLVSLVPPADVAAKLALEGGEPASELHVTLTYSKAEEPYDELTWCRVVTRIQQYVANYLGPFTGQIAGVGRFSATPTSDGKDVFYASVDVPGLSALREMIRETVRGAGCAAAKDHGFTPHMTLAYLEPDAEAPLARLEPIRVRFDHIRVSLGGRSVPIPLPSTSTNEHLKSEDVAAKGELAAALAAAEVRRRYWDLQSAFDDCVRAIGDDVEDGDTDDARERLVALVEEHAAKLLEYALATIGVAGDAAEDAKKSFRVTRLLAGLKSLQDEVSAVLAANDDLTKRYSSIAEKVRDDCAKGMKAALSAARRSRFEMTRDALRGYGKSAIGNADAIDALLDEAQPTPKDEPAPAAKSYAFELAKLRIRARLARAS